MRKGDPVILACLFPVCALAQDTTTTPRDSAGTVLLPSVQIAVTRDPRAAAITVPYAVSLRRRNATDARAQMQDVLADIPGLYVANRNNPTQDPRIVIRGVGARTAFGVRGVRVLQDGMPLTVADGQTPLDYLDVEAVDRIEVVRGSASSLYGNSSGGVVALTSRALRASGAEAEILAGSHGLLRAGARADGGRSRLSYAANVNQTHDDGYRMHARQRATRGSARARYLVGPSSLTAQLLLFDMPLAENPGALTAAQLGADRRMAEPLAVARNAGKDVAQAQLGVTYSRLLASGDVSVIAFGGRRSLDNPLTFAVIDLDRATSGLLLRTSRKASRTSRLTLGVDIQRQDDERQEYENCYGEESATARCPVVGAHRGAARRRQRERVSSIGPYVSGEMIFTDRVRLSAGVRADAITFDVRDHLVSATDPDESGRRTMRAVSPQVGLVARVSPASSLYASASTAFETPTATELGNKPDGSAGVNNTLEPQRARTLEAGVKGALGRVRYDLAGFATTVRDELVPFEIPRAAGRRFFRNAGRTNRRGAELAVATTAGAIELTGSATYGGFEFVEFRTASADFSGKTIPGVPARFADATAIWTSRKLQLAASTRFAASVFVDDANTTRAPGYELLNVRARGSLRLRSAFLNPALAVDNVFGREYVGAVNVNAAGGRYFEPAPGRTLVVSVTVIF